MNLWEWIADYARRAHAANDRERIQLVAMFQHGSALRPRDPQAALTVFAQGATLARMLDEPCWALLFDTWTGATYLHELDSIPRALEAANKNLVEGRKPALMQCPVLGEMFILATHTLYCMDVVGYAPRIQEQLDYLENDVPIDDDTLCRVYDTRTEMTFELKQLDRAHELGLKYLELAQAHSAYQVDYAACLLARSAFWRGDVEAALGFAEHGAHSGRRWFGASVQYLSQAWVAALSQRLGRDEQARDAYRRALTQRDRPGFTTRAMYYDALCLYLEERGDADQALAQRNQQLTEALPSESPYYESSTRLRRVRLLGRMGLPHEAELDALRAVLPRLLDSTLMQADMAHIEQGDFAERP